MIKHSPSRVAFRNSASALVNEVSFFVDGLFVYFSRAASTLDCNSAAISRLLKNLEGKMGTDHVFYTENVVCPRYPLIPLNTP